MANKQECNVLPTPTGPIQCKSFQYVPQQQPKMEEAHHASAGDHESKRSVSWKKTFRYYN
jgi:hypothetical protein